MNASPQQAKGFSIIELLIAVTLGLLLTVGLINIFINSKQSYRLQEATSRMQENGRFAVESLSRAIHLADFWGSVAPAQVLVEAGSGATDYGGPGACENAWLINPAEGLRGYEGAAGAPGLLPAGCINNYIANSDALALRYADPDSVVKTEDIEKTAAEADPEFPNGNFFVRTLVGRNARLFNGATVSAAAVAAIPSQPASPGAVINYRFKPELYYLRMFLPSGAGSPPVPTLYFNRAVNGEVVPTALVDGVEMMNFEYGLDTNGDLATDRYLKASAIAAADWAKVLSVRVSLIVRGDEVDNFRDEKTYTMAGGDTYKAATEKEQRFLRTQIVKEVQVRNRVRIRG